MNEKETEIYERVIELNHCMAEISNQMKPLRAALVDLAAQFTKYAKEKDRIERTLVQVRVFPMYHSGRRPAKSKGAASVEEMDINELQALLAKAQAKLDVMKGGETEELAEMIDCS